jgi:ADP-ribosylglycohydrolase
MDRQALMKLSLDGLSAGDAFGERFFVNPAAVDSLIAARAMPQTPWRWTDDTAMAISVCRLLQRSKGAAIDQDALAAAFTAEWAREPDRGYGGGATTILRDVALGVPWRHAAGAVFDGQGSMGNGAAMRVAPLGAFFAGDGYDRVVAEARRSAEVTHAHADGIAGGIAVAVAAAWAVRRDGALFDLLLAHTPPGPTRDGIAEASRLGPVGSRVAAARLGSGQRVLSSDTVPFCAWAIDRFGAAFTDVMWGTVDGLGDRDTTCAIVGGVSALLAGAVPAEFLAAREPLPQDLS